ncbi:MAG: hypothetical protein IPN26_15165 [Bacteroidetes bacterium]|nr:hypothetical protein [Bacteroidota bacterium]
MNINNFIDRDNIQALEYDRTKNKVGYSYQIGFFRWYNIDWSFNESN